MPNDKVPTAGELKDAIKKAVTNAVRDLFKIEEDFYFLVLFTSGEAHPPALSAGSVEGLERVVKKYVEEYGHDPDEPNLKADLKWSFADSPYDCWEYEKYFAEVQALFDLRPQIDEFIDITTKDKAREEELSRKWAEEYDLRLGAMVQALAELDAEDVFERKTKRKHLFLNVAPEHLNVRRTALLLNAGEALKQAIEDDALEPDDVE
ncbi:MAG: DUF4303 domain-containing protein [Spirochaetes bacterium]|nr:DUF4303 domain-containing protein [Spirochaetota bacterium]